MKTINSLNNIDTLQTKIFEISLNQNIKSISGELSIKQKFISVAKFI